MERNARLGEALNALLPQTQCQRCGYAACLPYAEAMAAGEADVNLCPPGGEATRRALADLLHQDLHPPGPVHADPVTQLATVVEADCIGCTKCIQACPMDAIIGAAGLMHSVVAQWCTGCELCVPVCPTDCIDLITSPGSSPALDPATAKQRFDDRNHRLAAETHHNRAGYIEVAASSRDALKDAVMAAVRRKRIAR